MIAKPEFCCLEKLVSEACHDHLQWVAGGTGDNVCSTKVKWLLAHCHDGVTWGRLENHSWMFSSAAFPNVSPIITNANLIELRLFGEDREVLIWRTEGGFSGRCLTDDPIIDDNNPCRPDNETRILLGDRMLSPSINGFTHVRTAKGLQQAVPLECMEKDFSVDNRPYGRWPLRLEVKHYFEQDNEVGIVRISASRLVNVKNIFQGGR